MISSFLSFQLNFESLILAHFKTIQDFFQLVLSSPSCPKISKKNSRATGPETSSLVLVSAIQEVSSSLIFSCLDQNKNGNTDP